MLKALLIDMDGTLADSLPRLYEAYNQLLAEYEIAGSREEFNTLNGPTMKEVMELLVKKYTLPITPEALGIKHRKKIDQIYQENLPLFPFAKKCLIYAKEKGLKLVLVTSAKQELAESFLKQHGLADFFEAIITPGVGDRGKPAPDLYLKALRRLNLGHDEALVLEDGEHGITSALEANLFTVVIHHHTKQPADLMVKDWSAFFQFLKEQPIEHPEFPFYPIDLNFEVRVEGSKQPKTSPLIDRIWEEKCRENPSLFNGKLFRFLSIDEEEMVGEFIDYKTYVASLSDPSLGLDIIPVGVSGVIYADEAILIGRRSKRVTLWGGLLETPPSGTIDPDAQVGSSIDILKQMAKELFEEINVAEEEVLSITPFALIEDKKGKTWELCFMIFLKEKKDIVSPNGEYESCFFVPRSDLLDFIESRYEEIIPFTRHLLANMV